MTDAIRQQPFCQEIRILDQEKFLFEPGVKTIQMDSLSCNMLDFNVAKQLLKPRKDGGKGLVVHQALETLKGEEMDIKLSNLPQDVRDKIMKLSQPIYRSLTIDDLEDAEQKKEIINYLKINNILMEERRQYNDTKDIKLESLVEVGKTNVQLRTLLEKAGIYKKEFRVPVRYMTPDLINELGKKNFVVDGKNTNLEYQTFKYDQLARLDEFLKSKPSNEERMKFRANLEKECVLPISKTTTEREPKHLHKLDANKFLSGLAKAWKGESGEMFQTKFNDRLKRFQCIVNGNRTLSKNYTHSSLTHLNPEEQKEVASKALQLLKTRKSNIGAEKSHTARYK
jgi:hypothetical protein